MTIKGLTDRNLSFPEIGQIRKGAPKGDKGQLGRDLTYFRVEFDEREQEAANKFIAKYGKEPQEINILLPFDEINRCWDAWLEAYTAGRMVARADGERFLYWIDTETGKCKVRDGEPHTPYKAGQVVGSYLDSKGKTQDITCEPVGRLKVVIPELQRLAYVTVMTTSVHDIGNISAQLEALKSVNGGKLAGIPMVLRRRPKKISTPKPDGSRARYTKWMLSIEADPNWVKAKLIEVKHAALPGNGLDLLPESIDGDFKDVPDDPEEENNDIPSHPEIDEQFDTDFKSPEQVKLFVQGEVEDLKAAGDVKPVTKEQQNIIWATLKLITAPGDTEAKRLQFVEYLFGTSDDLSDAQLRGLARYLEIEKVDGEYKPKDPIVEREVRNVLAFVDSNESQPEIFPEDK